MTMNPKSFMKKRQSSKNKTEKFCFCFCLRTRRARARKKIRASAIARLLSNRIEVKQPQFWSSRAVLRSLHSFSFRWKKWAVKFYSGVEGSKILLNVQKIRVKLLLHLHRVIKPCHIFVLLCCSTNDQLKIVTHQIQASLWIKWVYGEKRFDLGVIFIGIQFRSLEMWLWNCQNQVKAFRRTADWAIDWSHVVENKKLVKSQTKQKQKQKSDQNISRTFFRSVLAPIEPYWLRNLKSFEFKSNKNRNLEKLKWPFWSRSWESII